MNRKVQITRKYNLGCIGKQYESVEFCVSGCNTAEVIAEIEHAYVDYIASITSGVIH